MVQLKTRKKKTQYKTKMCSSNSPKLAKKNM